MGGFRPPPPGLIDFKKPGLNRVKRETKCGKTFLCQFGPKCLKNVQYLEILNPNRQWTPDHKLEFLGKILLHNFAE